jgi:periplasmic protein TonB
MRLFLIFLLQVFLINSCQNKTKTNDAHVYQAPPAPPPPPPIEVPKYASDVELNPNTLPIYQEGNEAFNAFVAKNLKQPIGDIDIQGTVWLSCIVEKDGQLTDIRVKRGVGGWNEEAITVLNLTSGKWKAAIDKGKTVKALMNIPIKCVIK